MKDLSKIKNTVASYLTDNKQTIWEAGNNVNAMKTITISLLDDALKDPDLPNRKAFENARKILAKCYGNNFLTTLVTYMSGMKVNG